MGRLKLSKKLYENINIGMTIRDKKGRIKASNRAAEELFSELIPRFNVSSDEEIISRMFDEKGNPFERSHYPPFEALALGVIIKDRELSFYSLRDERKVWLRVTSIPLYGRLGKVRTVFSLFTDISERKRIEEELQEKRKLLSLVLDNIPQFVFWKDRELVYRGCNSNFAKAAGMDVPENINGKSDFDLAWSREQAEAFRRDDRFVMDTGIAKYHIEEPQLQSDGRNRWLDTNKVPLKNEEGQIIGVLGTFEDITERLRLQEELKQFRNYLQKIINSMPSEIICVDRVGAITLWNREAALRNGLSEVQALQGRLEEEVVRFPQLPSMVNEVLEKGRMVRKERILIEEGKRETYSDITIFPLTGEGTDSLGAVIRIDDVTANVKMQEQLFQSQKMDALGQLSGGMAHDFNNILGGIFGASELLLQDEDLDEVKKSYLSIIKEASERARDVIMKLLTFSRSEREELAPVNVHSLIGDLVAILRTTLDKRVKISTNLDSEECTILGNGSELQTVLMNMAINAGHAMPEGGELAISTSPVYLDETYCRNSTFDLEKGDFLLIKMEDTGSGIPKEILSRIFDPFFTTKERGKGTGLGLSAAYGLIKQLKGAITVYSEWGKGTQFCLYLPLVSDQELVEKNVEGELIRGGGTILIAEDEKSIRILMEALLSDLGYDVLVAEDGMDGLNLYKERKEEIVLVITDMIMPRMNGADLFRALRDIDGNLPIILASGFTHEEELEKLRGEGLNGFINKPYNGAALSQLIDRVLNEKV
ncbi:MAG: PAS domain-containing protein [Spirochaetales bacterium]|nr:PAS domain-containing protein [Spirochaetales bacterium]